jgi:hypothetical protein
MANEILTAIEINCETGEVTERPLTAEELAQRELDAAQAAEQQAQREAEEAARIAAQESAKAKLAALGLSEDEIKAITGA